jgi:predicted nucleotidyltransferase
MTDCYTKFNDASKVSKFLVFLVEVKMNETLQIIRELKNHLIKHYGNNVIEVILFGSQKNASSILDSDVDVLILLNKPYTKEDENKLLDLCYEIDLKHNVLLDVHLISTPELNTLRGKQPIYYNVLKYGVYA